MIQRDNENKKNLATYGGYSLEMRFEKACKMTLSQRFTIYLPSVNRHGMIHDERRTLAVLKIRSKLRQLCGGTTEISGVGSCFVDGRPMAEPVTLISAYFSYREGIMDEFLSLCTWLKEYLDQDSVAAEINSNLYFI